MLLECQDQEISHLSVTLSHFSNCQTEEEFLTELGAEPHEELSEEEESQAQPVPLVPLTEDNEDAMENKHFQRLLKKLGIRAPATEQVGLDWGSEPANEQVGLDWGSEPANEQWINPDLMPGFQESFCRIPAQLPPAQLRGCASSLCVSEEAPPGGSEEEGAPPGGSEEEAPPRGSEEEEQGAEEQRAGALRALLLARKRKRPHPDAAGNNRLPSSESGGWSHEELHPQALV
ncbi:UNVERIFIED_CONTAM: hypothetical protein FKN15_058818 [Acipenser sinensis]